MVQVENEYDSYGHDAEYMGALRQALIDGGFDVPLFACNPPGAIGSGLRADLFQVVNFGSDPTGAFETLRKFRTHKKDAFSASKRSIPSTERTPPPSLKSTRSTQTVKSFPKQAGAFFGSAANPATPRTFSMASPRPSGTPLTMKNRRAIRITSY